MTHAPLEIEPVPERDEDRSLHFLAAGGGGDPAARARGRALAEMVRARRPGSVRLWWARRGRQCVAAAAVLDNPGRTGLLLFPPAAGPKIDRDAQAQVIRAVSAASLDAGLALVQAFLEPDDQEDAGLLIAGGYALLAELIYMELDLAVFKPARRRGRLRWLTYGQFGDAELGALIEATYAGSLDCPALLGVRDPADVLDGHRSSGVFQPESWWIAQEGGRPVGCILVNATRDPAVWDVVYLGVCPEFRGRGLSRAMLDRAARAARRRGASSLTLAVDRDNVYARRAYDQAGFRQTRRRRAYVVTRGGRSGGV